MKEFVLEEERLWSNSEQSKGKLDEFRAVKQVFN